MNDKQEEFVTVTETTEFYEAELRDLREELLLSLTAIGELRNLLGVAGDQLSAVVIEMGKQKDQHNVQQILAFLLGGFLTTIAMGFLRL